MVHLFKPTSYRTGAALAVGTTALWKGISFINALLIAAYFGADRPLESIEEEIRPFAGLKTLIVERDTKCPMPEFREALKPII